MDGISFWNMGPAANSWFDRKHFAVDRRPRCNASQLLAQPKENAQGHGGGPAAGVRPIYLLIYNVLTTQKEKPSKRMAFLFGIRLPQRPLPVTIF